MMTVEVFSDLLAATDASQLGRKLTEQLRELTGALTVMLVVHRNEPPVHEVLYACPPRRAALFSAADLELLCPEQSPETLPYPVTELPSDHPLRAPLSRAGIQSLVRIPLRAGDSLVGMLLLLDMPELSGMDEIAGVVTRLAPVLALALKNALAHELIQVQARQLQLQKLELEQRVTERTAELTAANARLVASRRAALNVLDDAVAARRRAEQTAAAFQEEVAERKLAEAQVRSSRAELAAIYDHAPIIMCLLDEDRRIVHLNNAAAALGLRQPEALLGLRPGDLVGCVNSRENQRGCGYGHGCEICALRLALQDTLDTGRSHVGLETRLLVINNRQPEDFNLIAHMARLEIGDRKRVLLCLEDVTQRKRSETALKQAEEQSRQMQKMDAIGQLAGGVAHDFNNILAAVLLYLGLLQSDPAINHDTRLALKELEKEVHRGSALTRQLLAFSRSQAMELKVLDLPEVVAGLLKMLRRLIGEHITIALDAPQILPRIEADAGMMEQVIVNLCVNARDAMPQGGRLTLHTEAVEIGASAVAANPVARLGSFLRLSVTDTGCGMDEPTLRRIFEPFFTTKAVGRGTGLGLATVHGIVKQHRGWIEVDSAVGRGSTFRVYLPVCDAPALPASPAKRSAVPVGRNELVLVVEDEAAVRKVTAATLSHHGYRTLEAANGPEALRIWEKHGDEIGLLFTDMLMPGGMNGQELAGRLREKQPGLKVILFTGYHQDGVAHPSDASLRLNVLHKPSHAMELLSTVRRCLDGA